MSAQDKILTFANNDQKYSMYQIGISHHWILQIQSPVGWSHSYNRHAMSSFIINIYIYCLIILRNFAKRIIIHMIPYGLRVKF